MFDIGFSEVLVIFVLALVVLGPEKLPRVAAQVGRWIGRARGMARQFREQLEEEVNLEEARRAQPPVTRAPPPAVSAPPVSPAAEIQSQPVPPSPSAQAADPAQQIGAHPRQLGQPAAAPGQPAEAISGTHGPHAALAAAEPEQHTVYPDYYSHAHPTDSLGRPIAAPTNEASAVESGQQDWVGGVTGTDKPAQSAADAAYAPSHERGT